MNLVTLFDESAARWGDKTLLCYQDEVFSYADIQDLSRRAARVLQAQGVGPGDRVALMCFNTPFFLIGALGALRLGAQMVPVNHKLQTPELAFIVEHSGAKLLLMDGALVALAQAMVGRVRMMSTDTAMTELAQKVPHFDAAVRLAEPLPTDVLADKHQAAQVLYTSGTTGRPKGCLHSHHNVFTTALVCAAGLSMTHHDRMLIAMPVWHASPLNNWLWGSLLLGASVVFVREYTPRGMLAAIQHHQVTMAFCAPVALLAPLELPDFDDFDLRSMRLWLYGGGPLGAEMAQMLLQRYRSDRFMQVYGMTETGPLGTALYPEDALRKAGSIGRSCMPGVRVRVVNEDGSPTPAGWVGEIQLVSEAAMLGYLDDPQATAAAYTADGWYRSGDLARVDEDGFLYVVDRLKDLITTGGENVYSKEVEDVLAPHPDIGDVAVVGRPHPTWGETVVAMVVLKPGAQPCPDRLTDYLRDKLARYKWPREYHFVDQLPRTPSGKLQKHLVRQSLA